MVSSLLNWAHGSLIVIGSKLIEFFYMFTYQYVRDETHVLLTMN